MYTLILPLYYCSPFLTRISILPLHDSCFPNSHCSVFTWKSSSDCSLSCCWACATADVRCVLSSAAAAWGRDALGYQISWCVAGGEHFCALQLQWISWCGNFIRLVELIRPPPEVWEWSDLGPAILCAAFDCLITIIRGTWVHHC